MPDPIEELIASGDIKVIAEAEHDGHKYRLRTGVPYYKRDAGYPFESNFVIECDGQEGKHGIATLNEEFAKRSFEEHAEACLEREMDRRILESELASELAIDNGNMSNYL